MADTCLLCVMLALGMNIVVGYAGLLDLGYVAFYAVGAYMFALLTSPHLTDNFTWIAAMFPAEPLQAMTDGRLDAGTLRPLLISLAMIFIMLLRPHGLWPAPEHGRVA